MNEKQNGTYKRNLKRRREPEPYRDDEQDEILEEPGVTAEGEIDPARMAIIKESYKAIRTNIILSVVKNGCKKIVFTSAVSGEGKSTTATNISVSLAQTDKKVLLVDADLRKPSVHKSFGFDNRIGMTNVLTGLSSYEEALKETSFPNLHVLCAGISVPNPAELLACEATGDFIAMLEEKFDYIMFDTSPINIVSDALPIIKKSDGVVMVVRQNYSDYMQIEKARQSIEFVGGKVLGFVLNDTNDDLRGKYYGRYGHYYNSNN